MSSSEENEHEGEEGSTTASPSSSTPTIMSRRLQTFGSPDLFVTVGVHEYQYRYHSFILASQSLYVDTLLSSPAASAEQKGRISFPDITVEVWEKMMKYLLPSAYIGDFDAGASMDDLAEIIPFYDKYQFLDGLAYCDVILAKRILPDRVYGSHRLEENRKVACLIAYIYNLDTFVKSKPKAMKWAKKCLSDLLCIDAEILTTLLPLIENDNETTKAMVSTFLGRRCVGMTLNEMRDLVKQSDFAEQCIIRNGEINMLDEQRDRMKIESLSVYGGEDDLVSGKYVFDLRRDYTMNGFEGNHKSGAMRGVFNKEKRYRYGDNDDDDDPLVRVGATDFYGSAWEIYQCTATDDEDERERSKKVLYRWENGIYTSLVPPTLGWKRVDDDGKCVKSDLFLEYRFDNSKYADNL